MKRSTLVTLIFIVLSAVVGSLLVYGNYGKIVIWAVAYVIGAAHIRFLGGKK